MLLTRLRELAREDDGPTAVEYAAMLGIIVAGAIASLSQFGNGVHNIYLTLNSALTF